MTETAKLQRYIPEMKIKERSVRFMSKAFTRLISIDDGLEPHFRSSICIFIPKLTPKYAKKPQLFLHVSNGHGSCLIRFTSREVLLEKLQRAMNEVMSDDCIDKWQRINDISDDIVLNGEMPIPFIDEEVMDVNAWARNLAYSVDPAKVKIRKEFDSSTQKKYQ